MDFYPISEERYYLQKLSRYLNYQISTSLLFISSFFWGFVLTAAIIATLVFTPLMFYVFIKLKKKSWLITFLVFVIIPTIACIIIGNMLGYLSAFIFIPLAFYYFYCFMLKNVINDRLEELISHERLQIEREEERENKMLWQRQFNQDDK